MRRAVKIISDIHGELRIPIYKRGVVSEVSDNAYREIVQPNNTTEILVLAGDIGKIRPDTLTSFLRYCCRNWSDVIHVVGNHEFYDKKSSRQRIVEQLRDLSSQEGLENYHFLDRDILTLDGQRFLGCTLWSVPQSQDGLNDFKWIRKQTTSTKRFPISCSDMIDWHKEDLQWLTDNVREDDIVITHFMPLSTADLISFGHKTTNSVYDSYYGNTDCWHLFHRLPKMWISGHTHQQFRVQVPVPGPVPNRSVPWICNPFGYPGEDTGCTDVLEPID